MLPDLQLCTAIDDSPAEALAQIEQAIEARLARRGPLGARRIRQPGL
jgi:predicted RNase H-like HicB family nuclease